MGDGEVRRLAYAAKAKLLFSLPVNWLVRFNEADPSTRNASTTYPCRIQNVPRFVNTSLTLELFIILEIA
ncbi:hypothetical protein JCM19046_3128 [Bacillus sp. JCM 19046]|nr:hypothetical protein JCM19046_3128 [Bacillus sp. JCM 19046]